MYSRSVWSQKQLRKRGKVQTQFERENHFHTKNEYIGFFPHFRKILRIRQWLLFWGLAILHNVFGEQRKERSATTEKRRFAAFSISSFKEIFPPFFSPPSNLASSAAGKREFCFSFRSFQISSPWLLFLGGRGIYMGTHSYISHIYMMAVLSFLSFFCLLLQSMLQIYIFCLATPQANWTCLSSQTGRRKSTYSRMVQVRMAGCWGKRLTHSRS